eukprot:gene9199-12409_t
MIISSSIASPEDCLTYGFNDQILSCKTCSLMQKVLLSKDEITIIKANEMCQQCCIPDKSTENIKYEKAVLEVDKRYLAGLTDLHSIVKMKSQLGLTVKYRFGPPTLTMFKSKLDDEPSDMISVGTWSKDDFKDYFKTHLIPKEI